MRVHINSKNGDSLTTEITLEDGTPLRGVREVIIRMRPDEIQTAELVFMMPSVYCDMKAIISEDHLRELAAYLGFSLVKIDE